MKTSKYYRLHNNYGGQSGGEIKPKQSRVKKAYEAVSHKVKGAYHSATARFRKPIQKSGLNMTKPNSSNQTRQKKIQMTPQEIFYGKKGTKSARLRQGQEVATGLEEKQYKRAQKIIAAADPKTAPKKPVSAYTQQKRDRQTLAIAKTLGIETKNFSSTQLPEQIKADLNRRKTEYAETTFGSLKKTVEKQTALDTSTADYKAKQLASAAATTEYLKTKDKLKALKEIQALYPKGFNFEALPTDYKQKLKNVGFNKNTFTSTSTNSTSTDKTISQLIKDQEADKKTQKASRKAEYEAQKKASNQYKKNSKAFEKHEKNYGTLEGLKQYSKNQTIAAKVGRVLKPIGYGVGAAAVATGIGALTAVAPPLGIGAAFTGVGLAGTMTDISVGNKLRTQKQLLKILNTGTPDQQESARKYILQKTNSPKYQRKMDEAIAKGKDLIQTVPNSNNLLSGTYNNFKQKLKENKTKEYSREEYENLKRYYKANRIKGIREGTRNNVAKNTKTTGKPNNTRKFNQKTAEQRLLLNQQKLVKGQTSTASTANLTSSASSAKSKPISVAIPSTAVAIPSSTVAIPSTAVAITKSSTQALKNQREKSSLPRGSNLSGTLTSNPTGKQTGTLTSTPTGTQPLPYYNELKSRFQQRQEQLSQQSIPSSNFSPQQTSNELYKPTTIYTHNAPGIRAGRGQRVDMGPVYVLNGKQKANTLIANMRTPNGMKNIDDRYKVLFKKKNKDKSEEAEFLELTKFKNQYLVNQQASLTKTKNPLNNSTNLHPPPYTLKNNHSIERRTFSTPTHSPSSSTQSI